MAVANPFESEVVRMDVLSKSRERRGLLQVADKLALIIAQLGVLVAIIELLTAFVKLVETVIKAHFFRKSSKRTKRKQRKQSKKNNRQL